MIIKLGDLIRIETPMGRLREGTVTRIEVEDRCNAGSLISLDTTVLPGAFIDFEGPPEGKHTRFWCYARQVIAVDSPGE